MYKLESFRNCEGSILKQNIQLAIGLTLLFAVFTFIFLPTQFLVCYRNITDFKLIVQPLSFLLAGTPATFVYFLMVWKRDTVVDTLDYLHGIVVERKRIL